MTNKPEHHSSSSRRGYIQSLDRGLQLLEILSESQTLMGLPELASMLDVDPSTVHRLLNTMLNRSFVSQDPISKQYRLGMKLVELSRHAIDSTNLKSICKPYLKRLVNATGESANLFVFSEDKIICIDQESSPAALAVTNDPGTVGMLHATASGKVVLAHLPDAQQKKILNNLSLEPYTPRTIIDRPSLEAHMQLIKRQGYAIDDEERYLGVRCIAAPVFDSQGTVLGSVSISGPSIRVTLANTPGMIEVVKKATIDISSELGYVLPASRSAR